MSEQPSLEQVYNQYQSVLEQLQVYESQINQINGLIADLDANSLTLKGILGSKQGDEVIIPLGGLISLKATLTRVTEVLLDIGSGVVSSKSIEETKTAINKRRVELTDYLKRLSEDHKKLSGIAQQLQNALNRGQVDQSNV